MKVDPGLAARLIDQEARYGPPGGHPLARICTRAEGPFLWDLQGNRYMDFTAGRGGVHHGHTHTRIASALVEQCLRLPLASPLVRHDRLPPLLEKLCRMTGFDAAALFAGAAAARGAALDLARRARPGAGRVLGFAGGPAGAADLEVPFGDLAAARAAGRAGLGAVLVEPVGSADLRVPPRGFLRGLREWCDAEGLVLVADETVCGLGRTGRLLAMELEGVRPDLAVLGPALTGGYLPAGAVLGTRPLLDALAAPDSPFDGSPLACAAALAALDVLTEERLVDRSAELGAYFLARLRALDTPRIADLRGAGLWAAVDLAGPEAPGLAEVLAGQGLLCGWRSDRILELIPPLAITRDQLDWALERLEAAFA